MTERDGTSRIWTRRGTLGAIGAAVSVGLPAWAEQDMILDIEAMRPGEFAWHPERAPKGAVAVVVSIPEQRVHVYRNGVRIAVSTCSTGKQGHETPTGVFTVLQKDKNHHSKTYNNAPMPNMNRLTWDGIALHAGNLPGYPASHGCVRLPLDFSEKLFGVTHVGTPVIIAGSHSDPWSLVHPGLLLGQGTESELQAAVTSLDAKSHPADWTDGAEYPITTLLMTGGDRRAVLMENGVEVAESSLTIEGTPILGEHVFVLNGSTSDGRGLSWVGLTHHPDPTNPATPEEGVLHRLHATKSFNRQLQKRMHPGMTAIISDMPATPESSTDDLVIMAADGAS